MGEKPKWDEEDIVDRLEAWILTIGDEIINGVITDTNRETISRELRAIGIPVRGMSSVGDHVPGMVDALELAMTRASVVIVSGGLGPTEDDKTAEAAARLLEVPLESNDEQLRRIRERFQAWGRDMSPSNAKQALFPRGAIPIPNDRGTAPGFMIEYKGSVALFFPGIPRELVPMLREHGIPALAARFGTIRETFTTKTLHVYGLTESRLGEILDDLSRDEEGLHTAFLPRFPIIRLRLDARADDRQTAENRLNDRLAAIAERIPENIISSDGRSMEEVVLALLQRKGWTLALAESISGGMIGEMVTRVAGSSATFMGSVVSYSNDMKERLLGVSQATLEEHGAVSQACAREMAVGARHAGRSAVGISATGIAGPGGGSATKPVGTFFVGLATPDHVISRGYVLPGSREWVRTLAAMQSLDMLRRFMLGLRIHGRED